MPPGEADLAARRMGWLVGRRPHVVRPLCSPFPLLRAYRLALSAFSNDPRHPQDLGCARVFKRTLSASRESRHTPQLTAVATIEACVSARLSYFSPLLARPRRPATRPAARPPQIHSLAAHTAPRSSIPRGSPVTSGSPSAVSSASAATPPIRSPTSASWPRRNHIASAANTEPRPRIRALSTMGLRRPPAQDRPLRPALPLGPRPRLRLRVVRRQPHPLPGRYGRTMYVHPLCPLTWASR